MSSSADLGPSEAPRTLWPPGLPPKPQASVIPSRWPWHLVGHLFGGPWREPLTPSGCLT